LDPACATATVFELDVIMCTRYVFTDPAEAIRDLFRITAPLPNWPPNYNVAPTHIMPTVRRSTAVASWR
jgi:putative SOS response-associated peptidase YedK